MISEVHVYYNQNNIEAKCFKKYLFSCIHVHQHSEEIAGLSEHPCNSLCGLVYFMKNEQLQKEPIKTRVREKTTIPGTEQLIMKVNEVGVES